MSLKMHGKSAGAIHFYHLPMCVPENLHLHGCDSAFSICASVLTEGLSVDEDEGVSVLMP